MFTERDGRSNRLETGQRKCGLIDSDTGITIFEYFFLLLLTKMMHLYLNPKREAWGALLWWTPGNESLSVQKSLVGLKYSENMFESWIRAPAQNLTEAGWWIKSGHKRSTKNSQRADQFDGASRSKRTATQKILPNKYVSFSSSIIFKQISLCEEKRAQ